MMTTEEVELIPLLSVNHTMDPKGRTPLLYNNMELEYIHL
jgi:hypothetical protein